MGRVMIQQAVYREGRAHPCGPVLEELAALRASSGPGDFLWIGLKDPTSAEFDAVKEDLRLHPLAVEDALKGRQRAKVELYDDTTFVVLKTLSYVEKTSDIETGEVMIFVGDHFVLTVRRGELSPLSGVRERLEQQPELIGRGPMAALHAIMDNIVDRYVEIDREVMADLEDIEAEVFAGADVDSRDIYALKREVLEFRRAVAPLAPRVLMLHSPESPVADHELRLRFRDVSDHLHLVMDHIETYDRLLTDILSAHLAQVSVQQNADMRRISAWVAMAAVPTMVAGIYGMNFEHMPELTWRFGYGMVLLVMAVVTGVLYWTFKRHDWL